MDGETAGRLEGHEAHDDRRRASSIGKKGGDNPHLWYDPATMPKVARAVSAALVAADPAHKSAYDANLAKFLDSLKPIDAKVADLHGRYAGVPVTATEPVFGYMSDAIGLIDAQSALPAGDDERH